MNEGKKRYVYKLTFPDHRVYIGIADSIEKRWEDDGRRYRGQAVYEAIQKFGWDNVQKEIVLYLRDDEKTIRQVESALIREYRDISYNESQRIAQNQEEELLQGRAIDTESRPQTRRDIADAVEAVAKMRGVEKRKKEEYLKRVEHGRDGFYECKSVFDEIGATIYLTVDFTAAEWRTPI